MRLASNANTYFSQLIFLNDAWLKLTRIKSQLDARCNLVVAASELLNAFELLSVKLRCAIFSIPITIREIMSMNCRIAFEICQLRSLQPLGKDIWRLRMRWRWCLDTAQSFHQLILGRPIVLDMKFSEWVAYHSTLSLASSASSASERVESGTPSTVIPSALLCNRSIATDLINRYGMFRCENRCSSETPSSYSLPLASPPTHRRPLRAALIPSHYSQL